MWSAMWSARWSARWTAGWWWRRGHAPIALATASSFALAPIALATARSFAPIALAAFSAFAAISAFAAFGTFAALGAFAPSAAAGDRLHDWCGHGHLSRTHLSSHRCDCGRCLHDVSRQTSGEPMKSSLVNTDL